MAYSAAETERRFWLKVNKTDGCWLWTASTRNKGYGAFAYQDESGRLIQDRAHRYIWRLHNGAIPDGMFVLHRCDVPACVNPEHLFLGTIADNNTDMRLKGRHGKRGPGKYGDNPRSAYYAPAGPHRKRTHRPSGAPVVYRMGEAHQNAKLTEAAVREMRAARKAGESFGSISRRSGIAVGHVFRIINRKVWRHIA